MAVRKTKVLKQLDYTWDFEASAKDNSPKSVLRYKDDFTGWASRCPLFGSEHPDLPGFLLVDIKASREPGDQIAVTLHYEANAFNADYPGREAADAAEPRYSVQIAGREEHILTYSFADPLTDAERKALLAISNGSETDDSGATWESQVTSAEGLAILAKIRKGNVAYKAGGLIYTERKLITALTELEYAKIGKIDNPPGPAGGQTNSWLYISASAEPTADGKAWQAEKQWEFSPDGWDEDLYTYTP